MALLDEGVAVVWEDCDFLFVVFEEVEELVDFLYNGVLPLFIFETDDRAGFG